MNIVISWCSSDLCIVIRWSWGYKFRCLGSERFDFLKLILQQGCKKSVITENVKSGHEIERQILLKHWIIFSKDTFISSNVTFNYNILFTCLICKYYILELFLVLKIICHVSKSTYQDNLTLRAGFKIRFWINEIK